MERKLRIVHVLKSSIYSGAENVAITIIKSLREHYDMAYIASEGPIRGKLDEEQIPYILLRQFSRKCLKQAIIQCRPDIVHAHDFSASVLCATVPGNFRLISHLHYDPPWTKTWNRKTIAYYAAARQMEFILMVSEKLKHSFIFAFRCKKKIIVVGNPIDGKHIKDMAAQRKEDGKKCDLIFVGRLVEQKNPQRFIELIYYLKKEGWKDIRAWMLGEGELRHECEDLIEKLDLKYNIEMKGFIENPYAYMSCASILCITSRWEGFGLVAVEANLLGVPVLTTCNSGCIGIYGKEAPELCNSDEEFIKKIQALRKNPAMYLEWKKRSLSQAQRMDNIASYMDIIDQVYNKKRK